MPTIEELETRIALLEGGSKPPPKRSDLVEVVFNSIYMGIRPGQPKVMIPLKMPKSPDNFINGNHYFIPSCEVSASHPWFRRI